MPGLLADVNVQGHLGYLRRLIEGLGLSDTIREMGLTLERFPDVGLAPDLDDRSLWNYCQENGWVLFTDNRNRDNEDSLQATVQDSWREGRLPVITLANKGKFENDAEYAAGVAEEIAELLFEVFQEGIRDQARIYVPRR